MKEILKILKILKNAIDENDIDSILLSSMWFNNSFDFMLNDDEQNTLFTLYIIII